MKKLSIYDINSVYVIYKFIQPITCHYSLIMIKCISKKKNNEKDKEIIGSIFYSWFYSYLKIFLRKIMFRTS